MDVGHQMSTRSFPADLVNLRDMLRFIKLLLFFAFMSQVWFSWHFHFRLMYHIAFGIIPFMAMWIAATLFFGMWLKKSENPTVRALGESYEAVFSLTAPMQGVFYVTTVFYVLGAAVIPSAAELYWIDWMYGMSYASWIVYGIGFASFLMVATTLWSKCLMLVVVGLGWAGFVYFMGWETEARQAYNSHPKIFTVIFFAAQFFMSVTSMTVAFFSGDRPDVSQKNPA